VYVNRKKDGDGKLICPLKMQAGFVENYWTPLGAKNPAWALALLTPQEVDDLFLQLGTMNPSRSSLDRLPKILHKQWEPVHIEYGSKLASEEKIPENAHTVVISLDGVMVGMKPEKVPENKVPNKKTEWRETSCGTISFFDKSGERLSTLPYGRMPESKKVSLKALLQQNVDLILKKRATLRDVCHLPARSYIASGCWTFTCKIGAASRRTSSYQ
jgi:hypothetical protein